VHSKHHAVTFLGLVVVMLSRKRWSLFCVNNLVKLLKNRYDFKELIMCDEETEQKEQ